MNPLNFLFSISPATFNALNPADRLGTLHTTREVHAGLHTGLTNHLELLHPGLGLRKGFQHGADWDKYIARLETEGFTGKAMKDKILSDFGSYYLSIPMVPNGAGGMEKPALKFSMDAMVVKFDTGKASK